MFSCNLRCRLIFLHGCSRTYRIASLCAGPVGSISYNLHFDCKTCAVCHLGFNKRIYYIYLTPSKTFIQISFNFSLSFLSSSGCFLERSGHSGEIKMSLKFSEFESFRDPKTTLHLTATDSIFKIVDSYQCLQYHSPQPLSSSTHRSYPSLDTASKSQVHS